MNRWDRRRIMLTADACRAVLIALLLVVPALGHQLPLAAELGAVYAVVAAQSVFAQFFSPSRLAVLGLIVAPVDRPQASGMLQATSSTASIIGPPLAAPLLFALGVQWALVIDALSFVISFAAIRSLRPPPAREQPSQRSGFRTEFRAGLRFFATSRVLVALRAGVVICTLGTGALNTLEVFFLRDNLHTSPGWLGTLYAAISAGAVGGALAGGWAGRRIGSARVFWIAMVQGGVLLLAYSRPHPVPGRARGGEPGRPDIRGAERRRTTIVPGGHSPAPDGASYVGLHPPPAGCQHHLDRSSRAACRHRPARHAPSGRRA